MEMPENPERWVDGDLESAADDERQAGGQTADRDSADRDSADRDSAGDAPSGGEGVGATVEDGPGTTFEPEEDPNG